MNIPSQAPSISNLGDEDYLFPLKLHPKVNTAKNVFML